ncbi:ribonuclease III [Hymenopellis radicata]|nr:ribonuclease III [Hymenopellis radicata]
MLPPLPRFLSRAVETQVFTHRSYFARPTHIFEDRPDDPSPDNEKLEHLGDTVLGLVVTKLMLEMYPGLRVGPSTKIRALMVGNATLADISVKYKLPEQLRLHPAQALTLKASTNVQADVFESFVGGLYQDQGLARVEGWLFQLFRPYAELAYSVVRKQHGLPLTPFHDPARVPLSHTDLNVNTDATTLTGHLGLFNQQLQKTNRQVEWVYSAGEQDAGTKTTPVWYVTVVVDGEFYGSGKGITKKSARNEAAKEGLKKLEMQAGTT